MSDNKTSTESTRNDCTVGGLESSNPSVQRRSPDTAAKFMCPRESVFAGTEQLGDRGPRDRLRE